MASSSASLGRPSSYDVFINFRGPDTRTNFIALLYSALTREKIHTFIDSEELWEGEEIRPSLLKAIQGSEISIPVISKSYAQSKYCLLELAEIWECHLSKGRTILPIFIDIEPGDVRHQTGSFEGPFQEYQEKYSSEDVEKWKSALTKVGNLKGWTLEGNATIEDQLKLVESIVRRALKELNNVPLAESKYLVGIDSHIDILLPKLNIGSDDVRFVAICGMGGLGKTTIANVVYNRISTSFNGRCFLSDVREKALKGDEGLVSLQNQLLKDILGMEQDISIVSQGSKLIERRLHREKVLLILDDVDDYAQLDALAGGIHWFGEGSRIIITTRNMHCLNVHKDDRGDITRYMPEELNSENSLQLLSLHAFSTINPPEEYAKLVHKVVRHAGGLPLTLEVLGSFLCDKNKQEWEDTLGGLKDILDNKVSGMLITSYEDKVFARLMISYNKLSDYAKIIFLDIACHFNGLIDETVQSAIIMLWEACKLYPRLAIKELTQMHLLKIHYRKWYLYDEQALHMHDELRLMGIRIATMNNNGDYLKSTRLWSHDQILKVFENHRATQMVEGIVLSDIMHINDLRFDDFAKMPKLRFLYISYQPIAGNFSHLSSQLRWLHWIGCPLKNLSADFYHEELVHLELPRSDIIHAWNCRPRNNKKRFRELKVLDLSYCGLVSISSEFSSWFPCLETLSLHSCSSLLQLPESICQMVSLKFLYLNFCHSFNKLPVSIGNLKHLVELLVIETRIEELPDGVGQLEKLEKLNVYGCRELVRLPTTMGRLRKLPCLDLRDTMILKLPDDFSKLSCLEVLKMEMAQLYEMGEKRMLQPLQISESSFPCQLKELYLEGYKNLESLPRLPSTLTTLEVRKCKSLQLISNLSDLKLLKELLICGCKSLVRLPNLSNLTRLKKFLVEECGNLDEIHCIEGIKSLEEFEVNDCPKLIELPDLSNLKRLRILRIIYLKNLEKIQSFEGTELLEELNLKGCPKLRKLPDLSILKKLKSLIIQDCESLEEIRGLEGTKSLKEVRVEGCHKLRDTIHVLEGTESLEELYVEGYHKLTQLPDFSNLKRLRKVFVSDCANLEKIQCIKGAESLEYLEIEGCHKLTELPNISYLKRLSRISISDSINLVKIHGFEGAQSLQECVVTGCDKLTEARRKIYGQGRLVDDIVKGVEGCKPIVTGDRGSPILCIVFASRYRKHLEKHGFWVQAYICRQGVRRIHLKHSISVEDQSELFTSKGDIIYIHHFKGFDWFGFPLESNDAIQELTVFIKQIFTRDIPVKFCRVLFEDKDSKQQMPDKQSSAKLVKDFFRWSDADNDDDVEVVEEEEDSEEEVEEEEMGGPRAARNRNESYPDEENIKRAAGSEDCNCFVPVKAVWDCFSICFTTTGSSKEIEICD